MQRFFTLGLCMLCGVSLPGCATPGRGLTFDVRPCAGEVHMALADVQVTDGAGHVLPDAPLAGPPRVMLRDGKVETELGQFEPGCGGGLRVHVTLPATRDPHPVVVLRGQLADGTAVTGSRTIAADEYR